MAPGEPDGGKQPVTTVDDLLAKGRALSAENQYDDALPFFERATQLDPDSFDAWANLGLAYNETGRHGDDLAAYDRALALDEKQAWVWGCKGKALLDCDRFEEALAVLDRALALDPEDAIPWSNKGAGPSTDFSVMMRRWPPITAH